MIPHKKERKADIMCKKTGILGRRQYPVPKNAGFWRFL